MKHINNFNNRVQELISSNPDDETLKFIKKYKEFKGYKEYYSALDSLGFEIKFGFLVEEVKENYFLPCVKYYPGNAFNHEAGIVRIIDTDAGFTTLEKCYEYLAKEYIYRIMNLDVEKQIELS